MDHTASQLQLPCQGALSAESLRTHWLAPTSAPAVLPACPLRREPCNLPQALLTSALAIPPGHYLDGEPWDTLAFTHFSYSVGASQCAEPWDPLLTPTLALAVLPE